MKKLLGLVVIMMIASSCSTIEDATAKWKTPESADAGLAPGEKSNYLDTAPTTAAPAATPKKKKAKKKPVTN